MESVSDGGGSNSHNIHRLVFTSRNALEGSVRERTAGLTAIVATSQRNNAAEGLSSVLALHRGAFAQGVEGDEAAVARVLDRVRRDRRHHDIDVLQYSPVRGRQLPDRAMLLVGHEGRSRAPLIPVMDRIGREPVDTGALFAALGAAAAIAMSLPKGQASSRSLPTDRDPLSSGGATRAFDPERGRDGPGATVPGLAAAIGERGLDRTTQDDGSGASVDLREAEALASLFGTALIGDDGTFLRVNANLAVILGYEPGELIGTAYRATLHPDDGGHTDRLWTVLSRGETVRIDRRAVRRDGREVWLRSTYHPRTDLHGRLRDVRGGSVCLNSDLGLDKWIFCRFQAAAGCGSRSK